MTACCSGVTFSSTTTVSAVSFLGASSFFAQAVKAKGAISNAASVSFKLIRFSYRRRFNEHDFIAVIFHFNDEKMNQKQKG